MPAIDFAPTIQGPDLQNHIRRESGRAEFWSYDFSDPITLVEFDADPLWVHAHQPVTAMLS
jgi:hypothetical protein